MLHFLLPLLACSPGETLNHEQEASEERAPEEESWDTADTADTDTDTDTDTAVVAGPEEEAISETWECWESGTRATYVFRFATQLTIGEPADVGLWTIYDPGYLDYFQDLYGIETAAAQYASVVTTDVEGYVFGACLWLETDGYRGFFTEKIILVLVVPASG